ncbi:RHS repeat domain-containing protein [Xanthomonas albilineans]|uniref:RHS repeat domain-containing protein n=1 Tax=Xanthomonas albilineans TaxID=29447 RepID=UPI0005F33512|nr:RHS repeat domain-containing protein [Xanthomonas albilineans]
MTYAYDVRDRRISRTDALGQAESWTYDSMDRVATHTDRRNRTTTYSYDALGRRSAKTENGTATQFHVKAADMAISKDRIAR